jgi:hypothetical protein
MRYIWGSGWSVVKVLYLMVRYYGLINLMYVLHLSAASPDEPDDCFPLDLWSPVCQGFSTCYY